MSLRDTDKPRLRRGLGHVLMSDGSYSFGRGSVCNWYRWKSRHRPVVFTGGRVYWRSWRPIWVAKAKEGLGDLEEGLQAADYDYQTIAMTFARGMIDPDEFISAATAYYNEQVKHYESTGGRRHSIRYIHGTAGNTATITMKAKGGSSQPTSYSDIRACLSHRPLGWEPQRRGPTKTRRSYSR